MNQIKTMLFVSPCHFQVAKSQQNKFNHRIYYSRSKNEIAYTHISQYFSAVLFFAEYLFSSLIIFVFQHFNIRNGVRETETVSVEAKSEN